ncbi:MAG TPA: hypothetical protein VF017_22640 [Thermoanaerobaculia bacterium]|nr:hypothetical protein [Thermoanaerobaculia bacterium]
MSPRTRLALVVLALGLAVTSALMFTRFRAERLQATEHARTLLGAGDREGARLMRSGDPLLLGRDLARLLLARSVRERSAGQRSGLQRQRAEVALEAASAARQRAPANWEAAMLEGAAVYLGRSLARDSRLLTEPQAWEKPLAGALTLAPARRDPERFLAMAYLELWAFLPAGKKAEARRLVAAALEDPTSFDQVIQPWLAIEPNLDNALAPMPDDPGAWAKLFQLFGLKGDWRAWCRVEQGRTAALERRLASRIAQAEGKGAAARTPLLGVLTELPVDGRFAPLFARAMAALPPGPVGPDTTAVLERWARWGFDLELAGRSSLPPETFERLAFALQSAPEPLGALAHLGADDLPAAELAERRSQRPQPRAWAPYWLLKARRLAERGDRAAAREALLAAEADPALAPLVAGMAARLGFPSLPAAPAPGWRLQEGRFLTRVATGPGAPGLRIRLDRVPQEGAAVELVLDGSRAALAAIQPGQSELLLPQSLEPGLHQLELRTLASVSGALVVPGTPP